MNSYRSAPNHSILLIRGAGEMATGIAHKLFRCGYRLLLTEIESPLAIRRAVAFAEAIFCGEHTVEGVLARSVHSIEEAWDEIQQGRIPVLVDAELSLSAPLLEKRNALVVDARMLKVPVPNPFPPSVSVIGLGPGFSAPETARFVIETNRGHHLGRVIHEGSALLNTGVPGEVAGVAVDRVVYAPSCGVFQSAKSIGDQVNPGDIIGYIDQDAVTARLSGVLRGILHDGITVRNQMKLADIDPRGNTEFCVLISDKARTIAGGVLEAVLRIENFSDGQG